MKRMSLVLSAAAVAVASFLARPMFAGDPPVSAPAEAPKAEAPKTEATKPDAATTAKPETATPSPIHSMMKWLGKQVAPNLEHACPSTAEGEKAWRTWFAGGKDVPAASVREALLADGWTADRFVSFFQAMAKAQAGSCEGGKCADGKCADGKCCGECDGKCADGKCADGKCADGKGCGGKCNGGCPSKEQPADTTKPTEKPADAPAKP